jgi:putative tricarboxylic transport membrane protein
VLKVPERILLPIILILCVVGTFALRNTFFDTGIMFCFGLLGYFMKKFGFPIVPMLLAIILGPNLEEHLRMSLIISQGDFTIFLTHPISLAFIMISIVSFLTPLIKPLWKKK